jgi:thiamine-phosphate pyrophosphorylase
MRSTSSTDPPSPIPGRLAVVRILDANLNRASEGLRVVEEYVRFVMDDGPLAATYKQLRHDLTQAFAQLATEDRLKARDTVNDVGTQTSTASEYQRMDIQDVVVANVKRVEQALRVLEEYGKVISPDLGRAAEQVRYRAYEAAKLLGVTAVRSEQLSSARLYALIDGGASLDTFVSRAQAIVEAGAEIVQLRDKRLPDRELLDRGRALRQLTRGRALFIMNDRPDLAVLCDADGVHVGQDELSVKEARTILGPRKLVGVSTHSLAQARQAVNDGADYVGCGPTFASSTKTFEHFPGVEFLREVAAHIRLPAFAIGGITLHNIHDVIAAGIDRVALGAAITQAADPALAVHEFRALLAVPSSDS